MISTLENPRLARTGASGPLSDSIIHAEPGKFYVYSSVFTAERPLFARVFSIKSARATGLPIDANNKLDDVWVAPANIAIEDFYVLCAQHDSMKLVDICEVACLEREVSTKVVSRIVVAVITSTGKYSLFLVKEISPTSISIDACHVLLS
ncbi:MAG: hypothetical protein WC666_00995 [Candidatus Paceibacterota bacterium]|jgi:hypothetical protein